MPGGILIKPLLGAGLAPIPLIRAHIRVIDERNHTSAAGAVRGLKRRRVFELFEIVFVGPIPGVYFRLKGLSAARAGFPVSLMAFPMVISTQRVTVMVSIAAVAGIRKKHIFMRIVTDPVSTAIRLREVPRFSAKPAPGLGRSRGPFRFDRDRFFGTHGRWLREICRARVPAPPCLRSPRRTPPRSAGIFPLRSAKRLPPRHK
jgi:hypothetical protein